MRPSVRRYVLTAVLATMPGGPAIAQDSGGSRPRIDRGPWIKQLSRPQTPISTDRKIMIPMRDGVNLAADIYTPNEKHADDAGRFPVILHRTPYGRNLQPALYAPFFAERGYVYVCQDTRGRFDSEGDWYPFRHEMDDGSDTIDWIVKQPWCNGRVGMLGASYEGACAWFAARSGNAHLKAVAAMVAVADPDQLTPYRGGAFHVSLPLWAKFLQILDDSGSMSSLPLEKQMRTALVTPLGDVDEFLETTHTYVDEFIAHPPTDDDFWSPMRYQRDFANMNVASLSITGWYDIHRPGSTINFAGMRQSARTPQARASQHLIIGPWAHLLIPSPMIGDVNFGPESVVNLPNLLVRFFDHYLKYVDTGLADEPPAAYFSMGDNRWHREAHWPPPNMKPVTLHLASDGTAARRDGGGRLLLTPTPCTDECFETYRYDPENPSSWIGSYAMTPEPQMTEDKSQAEDRADVLDYTSPPLAGPVEITGTITLSLSVATDAADTDFAVEVFRQTPAGRMSALTSGIQRLRYRTGSDEPVTPGTIVPVEIECLTTSQRFEKGDRIRVQIASAAVPVFARHLNTLDPLPTATRAVVATNRIHHSPDHPSTITIPVIPREDAPSLNFAE